MRIQDNIGEFLNRNGCIPSEPTPDEDLEQFFKAIRPIAIECGLIRVGAEGDGGYLVPDDLQGIEACYSPGVAEVATFEKTLYNMGIKSFMADYSVNKAPMDSELFNFEKKFLGDINDEKFIRLEDWVTKNLISKSSDLILQMDIEGAEFPVFLDTPRATLQKFRIMVVEFHCMGLLLCRESLPLVKQTFDKILKDFAIIHIHPNNCSAVLSHGRFEIPTMIEVTFYRRDRVVQADRKLSFPHALDSPNKKQRTDVVLPECWW